MSDNTRNGGTVLVLSQGYELFFGISGTIDKCLFEPGEALLTFARAHDAKITFYVDAGMLLAMRRYASVSHQVTRMYEKVRRHVESLAQAGHEIGLHVHPHWEDTRWTDDGWDFSESRYQLRDFSDNELAEIMHGYAGALNDLADGQVTSYRAGGFCIEPFGRIRPFLAKLGITVDSSVVPGARLEDPDKGFDFSASPDVGWWRFGDSPTDQQCDGQFIEVAITPLLLPVAHYWGRLIDRLTPGPSAAAMGDGVSKAIGKREVLRRLLGAGRVSELSLDAAKAHHLSSRSVVSQPRPVWQVMGHPKLLGRNSFDHLINFMHHIGVDRIVTVSGLAHLAEQGELCVT